MDWSKQAEEIVKNWTEAQQALWNNWSTMMRGARTPASFNEVWGSTVEMWKENVNKTLATQAEWTESWFENLDKTSLPEQVQQWADQGQTMSKQWLEMQSKLWQGWFDFIKQSDPASLSEQVQSQGQNVYDAWQETAEKVMAAQMDLVKMWMPGQPKSPANGESAAKKKTAAK